MAEQQEYKDPLYRASGKGSFFEVFDALEIGKVRIMISLYDQDTHKTTQRAMYYVDYEKMWALCAMIINGTIDNVLAEKTGFPCMDYGIPGADKPRMRELRISPRTERNRYMVSITEKERRDKWDKDLPDLAKATFFLPPLDLLMMAKKVDWYIGLYYSQHLDKIGLNDRENVDQ